MVEERSFCIVVQQCVNIYIVGYVIIKIIFYSYIRNGDSIFVINKIIKFYMVKSKVFFIDIFIFLVFQLYEVLIYDIYEVL